MLFQLTNAAVTLLNESASPITLSTFRAGSAVGYVPSPTDTNIRGALLYSGTPSAPEPVDANVVRYTMYMDYTVGDFSFGEIGLFLPDNTLFALAAGSTLTTKTKAAGVIQGNSIRVDAYLSMVGVNYFMFLDMGRSDNHLRVPTLDRIDFLPPVSLTAANVYVVRASSGVPATLAWNDRYARWNFSDYEQRVATGTVAAASATNITSNNMTGEIPAFVPTFPGEYVLQFTSGSQMGRCRAITSRTGNQLSFLTGFAVPPQVSDSFEVVKRSDLTAAISNFLNTIDTNVLTGPALSLFGLFSANDVILRTGTRAFTNHQSMGGNRLTSVGNPTVGSDSANKTYVDGLNVPLAARVSAVESLVPNLFYRDGSALATGAFNLNNNPIYEVATPLVGSSAANKSYVDTAVANALTTINGAVAAPVQDLDALALLTAGDVVDKQLRLVEDTGAIWRYDQQSAVVVDGVNVVEGPAGVGRWIRTLSQTQNHTMLNGLQGGNGINEFYHLTLVEYAYVNTNTAPTQAVGNNTTKQATTAYVQAEFATGAGAQMFKRDGTVAATNNFNMAGHLVRSLGTPLLAGDATPKSYVDSKSEENAIVYSIVFGG